MQQIELIFDESVINADLWDLKELIDEKEYYESLFYLGIATDNNGQEYYLYKDYEASCFVATIYEEGEQNE